MTIRCINKQCYYFNKSRMTRVKRREKRASYAFWVGSDEKDSYILKSERRAELLLQARYRYRYRY